MNLCRIKFPIFLMMTMAKSILLLKINKIIDLIKILYKQIKIKK